MRFRTLIITIALTVLAAGVVAAPAVAGDPSLPKLKQQLRHAKQSRDRARVRARAAAADLAGARELFAATNVVAAGSQAPAVMPMTPPATMSQLLAATLLADGVVTADEVTALQARSTAATRVARRWTVSVRRLQRRVRELVQIATLEPARRVEAAHRDRGQEVRREPGRPLPHDDAGVQRPADRGRHVQGSLPVLPGHVGRQLEPLAAREHLQRLGADPRDSLRSQQRDGPEPVAQHVPHGLLESSPSAPAASPRRGTPPAPRFLPQLTPGSARRVTTAERARP